MGESFFFSFCCCCYTLLLLSSSSGFANAIGINYGQIANNLPLPEKVVPLVNLIGASKVKLYDASPKVLTAFANSGVEFIVGLGNEYLVKMSDDQKQAQAWVKDNVQKYLPKTKITCITIGNEVLTFNDTSLSAALLPAMQNIHTALVNVGLDKQVTVTTAHSLAVLQTSYPPSFGTFRKDLIPYLCPVFNFLSKTGSPFLINAYPYFAYKDSPKQISLDYVLFQSNQGTVDPSSNLHYDNMLFAQIDAVYSALAAVRYPTLPVQVSETGWPSKGDTDEIGATPENAKKYNGNLFKLLSRNVGTPLKPKMKVDIFVFAMFNENMKPGPTSERNYGLFKPDGTAAYPLGFSGVTTVGNTTTGGATSPSSSNSTSPSPRQSPPNTLNGNPPAGYLSISLAADRYPSVGLVLLPCLCWIAHLL